MSCRSHVNHPWGHANFISHYFPNIFICLFLTDRSASLGFTYEFIFTMYDGRIALWAKIMNMASYSLYEMAICAPLHELTINEHFPFWERRPPLEWVKRWMEESQEISWYKPPHPTIRGMFLGGRLYVPSYNIFPLSCPCLFLKSPNHVSILQE